MRYACFSGEQAHALASGEPSYFWIDTTHKQYHCCEDPNNKLQEEYDQLQQTCLKNGLSQDTHLEIITCPSRQELQDKLITRPHWTNIIVCTCGQHISAECDGSKMFGTCNACNKDIVISINS